MMSHILFMSHPLYFFKCVFVAIACTHENPVEARREQTVILSVRTTSEGGQESKIHTKQFRGKEKGKQDRDSLVQLGAKEEME